MADATLNTSPPNFTTVKQRSINLPAEIQSHGVVLVLQEPELRILQVSDNTIGAFGIAPSRMLGQPLEKVLDVFQVGQFRAELTKQTLEHSNSTKVWVRKSRDNYSIFDAVFHRSPDGYLVLELEATQKNDNISFLNFYHLAKASIDCLAVTANLPVFGQIIVAQVRKIAEFDRVMLYKFDLDGHGEVIAEDKVAEMESYLGLHFPASDIPPPARKMFLANRIRAIPNLTDRAVSLVPATNPLTNLPTDLTLSMLRSTHRCHTEYLQDMGVAASLTISLIKDGRLWGLIVCHHRTPKLLPYELRQACALLGQVIFDRISIGEDIADYAHRAKLAHVQSLGLERMARQASFVDALMGISPNLLDLFDAGGAAILVGGKWTTIGKTPIPKQLDKLVRWLSENIRDDVFSTDALSRIDAAATEFQDIASGMLTISLSPKTYILCFRPEVLQTIDWGGDPYYTYPEIREPNEQMRLSPRRSFELWKELVEGHSRPWKAVEMEAARELRKSIVNAILRQAEELAITAINLERSNTELKQFAYVASHDLQEPLNQVTNYVRLLESRYGEKLDRDAHEFIGFAVQGVNLMQTLIDDVLAYSQVQNNGVELQLIDAEAALARALSHLRGQIEETSAIVTADPLPTLLADRTQLSQLFQNLIGNAIKFRIPNTVPEIHIGAIQQAKDWLFSVSAKGIGIEPQFFDRIFIIFQRLHTRDEYPGTGMGLTICKKIVEYHHGKIWVESQVGEYATFLFTIPIERDEG
jgi:two-component system, chemotaxis family, sensor kinase Cph1